MIVFDKTKIITYGLPYRNIKIITALLDDAEKVIYSLGMASNEHLEVREIINSVFNAIDVKDKQFWLGFQTIANLYMTQSIPVNSRSICDIRLTSQNQEKYNYLEQKMIARFGNFENTKQYKYLSMSLPELIFNSLLAYFNNVARNVVGEKDEK